jgi:hypothetical protein
MTDANAGARAATILLLGTLLLSGCAADRLAHDEARQKIAQIGRSNLIPDAIEIRRIVSQTETEAIAESSVTLAFQFKKAKTDAEWQISAVRLGDRDWISLDELLSAINQGRRRTTIEGLQKLAVAIAKYRDMNGSIPTAPDIVRLTDVLHPLYISELVRDDGWGDPIDYQVTGTTFRLVSSGPDGVRGTPDDIVFDPNRPVSP